MVKISFKRWLVQNDLLDPNDTPENQAVIYKKAKKKYAVPSMICVAGVDRAEESQLNSQLILLTRQAEASKVNKQNVIAANQPKMQAARRQKQQARKPNSAKAHTSFDGADFGLAGAAGAASPALAGDAKGPSTTPPPPPRSIGRTDGTNTDGHESDGDTPPGTPRRRNKSGR